VVQPQPAAATPQVPARTGAAASATTNLGTNKGYNAQTAVGGAEYSPAWVAGLGALVAAGAAVAVRRRADASAAG
jgi:MYXO-CTERM domain-containing protein